ncbi:nuclear transport factor 2 family protein [Thermopolyspora sp. NPDC052614]|uniref:nuclear transport factor 2 family protein n=1 Tax=Thermopolyspora sp. NPDC052614 TaxID=3155682 RepID=UPI0034217A83
MIAQEQRTIDALARDVTRVESLRAVKNLQRGYAHYSQFGQWSAMAALFAADGILRWGEEIMTGRGAIRTWFEAREGAMNGRAPGTLHTEIIDEPLVNLSADGHTAKARWMTMRFLGDGKGTARIEGGVYENDYVLTDGRWLIATMNYHPQFEGDYHDGWTNVGGRDLPRVPMHFTSDEAGIPIPAPIGDPPPSGATIEELAERIRRLNDEDAVRNLQNAYGYYVDRKMWTDVVDLFIEDAVVMIAGVGEYRGRAGVRRAMERMGPENLTYGQLNDHMIFDLIVEVLPGGREALSRGIELALLGDATKREGAWEFSVFRNRFIKEDGLWKLKEISLTPLMRADYREGWGNGGISPPTDHGAQRSPAPTGAIPAFLDQTTVERALSGEKPANQTGLAPYDLADLARRLARSQAYDGVENVSSVYGYYLDDFQWSDMAAIFAVNGHKQSPFAGYYVGRDRIIGAANANWGPSPERRSAISFHWRTQPVIHVSHDGRSANLRTRLFQPRTSKDPGSTSKHFYMGGLHGGMYPNDQAVLENGIWRLWSLTIDEHYFASPDWKGGWASAAPRPQDEPPPPPSRLLSTYPPDIPLTDLGRRQDGFRGGTGKLIEWPAILPMWFHYRNPVSGRVPENFWPDCVPCEKAPHIRMTAHGYQKPPNGPEIDGVDLT